MANPYAVDFTQATEPAFSGLKAASEMSFMEKKGAYLEEEAKQLRLQNEAKQKEDAFLNTTVDVPKIPQFAKLSDETKQRGIELFNSLGLGKDGKMTYRELKQGLYIIGTDPKAFEHLAEPEIKAAEEKFNLASTELYKAQDVYKKDPNPINKQKLMDAEKIHTEANTLYQTRVANTARGSSMAAINGQIKQMIDDGLWGRLPEQVRVAYLQYAKSGDIDGLNKYVLDHYKSVEKSKLQAQKDEEAMKREKEKTNRKTVSAPGKPTTEKPTAGMKEYEYAKKNGYKGSFEDWKKPKKKVELPGIGVTPTPQKKESLTKKYLR